MKHSKSILSLVIILCVIANACAPATPEGRIRKYPEKYDALRAKDRELVAKGQIRKGMTRDAVSLAWGEPDRVLQGSRSGNATERWDFSSLRPVYSTGFYGGFGYYGAPYRYGRGFYPSISIGPDVTYLPSRTGTVWFIDDRVDSWEQVR